MKVCAEPGCPALVKSGRCQQHRIESPTYLQRDWADRKRRERVVAAHVAKHGWWCPGHGKHQPHPSRDLTADHDTPVVHGGINGPLTVRCRSCNSKRQANISPSE